ncbi:low affinity potassium transporter [Tulasnella sp. 417]|nr:low affinity potassium transporter [Tulasnella sp. 417]
MPRSVLGYILEPAYGLVDRLHLNFFRIHVLWFIINPIFWSIIFYVSSGQYPVSYIDSLFLCTSAHTVTGLSTVNLSTLTGFQQAILFYLMCIGNYTVVSLVMVIVRKHYFVDKVLKTRPIPHGPSLSRIGNMVRRKTMAILGAHPAPEPDSKPTHHEKEDGVTTEVETVRGSDAERNTQPAKSEGVQLPGEGISKQGNQADVPKPTLAAIPPRSPAGLPEVDHSPEHADPQATTVPPSIKAIDFQNAPTLSPKMSPGILGDGNLYRTESPSVMTDAHTPRSNLHPATPGQVNFAIPLTHTTTTRSKVSRVPATTRRPTIGQPGIAVVTASPGPRRQGTGVLFSSGPTWASNVSRPGGGEEGIPASLANQVQHPEPLGPFDPQLRAAPTYERRFGGFPGPLTLGARFAQRLAPKQYADLKRRLTLDPSGIYAPISDPSKQGEASTAIERTRTEGGASVRRRREATQATEEVFSPPLPERPPLAPPHMQSTNNDGPIPPHLRFERPSFSESDDSSTGILTDIGVEVKKTVLYLKHGILKVGRNSAFLNTDQLTDEQLDELGGIEYRALRALTWIVGLYWVGTQLTMFIIFVIYLYTRSEWDYLFENQPRLVPKAWFAAFQAVSSYTGGGLTLVDQGMVPFASAYVIVIFQGWLIVAGSLGLPVFLRLIVFVEWFGFLILDIGIPTIQAIPLNVRVLSGLFQSIAVRASGFAIVPLGAVAPAVKFLYMVMMYISAYPIAMSIRSTNVYEQRSLGVYEDVEEDPEDLDPDVDEDAAKLVRGPKGEVLFSKYLGMHVRRQLSYDLWWLALALFLILITERGEVMNHDSDAWFNQFTVMFELVSAYATVGLSLGIPTDNFSLSGAFKPLSKFIVCLVMLRGRHRDLPQAIDRAILLPHEFSRDKTSPEGHHIVTESLDPSNAPNSTQENGPLVTEKRQE